ncbi:MAG: glycoside hydrolase family 16 protein [Flavisolibacter sp.]|nr:glycoside hydrolase family 16 protein [Flavisolibacter sp.]
MKRTTAFFLFLSLLACLPACEKSIRLDATEVAPTMEVIKTSAVTATETTTAYTNLVWADEFNGTSVNKANWGYDLGGGGWGNNEKEYYQAANATVANGNLVITAKKQRVKGYAYTSARLKTQGKQEFTYGRIEARIKLPMGQGLWPAFWMLGANINTVSWPACGEIDIMEHINVENTIYGTIHWDNNGHASYGGNTTTTPADYHIYAVEWDAASIRWYVDNTLYATANIQNGINGTEEFQKPFFILLNLAVGGNWPGQTIDNSKLPASMYVDYVRVYQ